MYLKKFFLKSTNSTNDEAIKKIKQGDKKGIIIAEKQKKGRGRYGNKWISIKGNLFISIFFNIDKKKSLNKITKKNCVLLKKIFNNFINEKIQIKPPNDLLINKEKFCGILQETVNFNEKKFIIIGIGVNLFKSPNIKNYPTTHLSNYNEKINKMIIFKNIKKCYEKEYLCI
tara:strand:+ start:583 stop:1098 length:516 start_codon:yes stop_codon:yes gene_type:complete